MTCSDEPEQAGRGNDLPRFRSLKRDGEVFGEGVVFLMYHKIGRPSVSTPLPALYVQPQQLSQHINELEGARFSHLSFAEGYATGLLGGSGFCLTFDDGFCNVFHNALPILRARKLQAIQFIVADRIGRDDSWDRAQGGPREPLMTDAQIGEWIAAGQEIGSHSLTHPWLTHLSPQQAQTEIRDSKRRLEDRFGVPIRYFCYPYGAHNPRIRDLVTEAGYEAACTTRYGAVTKDATAFELPRVLAFNARRDPKAILSRLYHILKQSRPQRKG